MAVQIQLRQGTAAQWAAANPILAPGEPGVDLTSGRMKMGDGLTRWSDLPWYEDGLIAADGNVRPTSGPSGTRLDFDPTTLPIKAAANLLGADFLVGHDEDEPLGFRTSLDSLISSIIGPDFDSSRPLVQIGSFEPTLYSTSGNPTSITYTVQRGRYVRVGPLVHVELALATSARVGGGGNVRIGHIPFTSDEAVVGTLLTSGLPMPGAPWMVYGFGGGTSNGLRVIRTTDGGSISEMQISQWPSASGGTIQTAFSYIAAPGA